MEKETNIQWWSRVGQSHFDKWHSFKKWLDENYSDPNRLNLGNREGWWFIIQGPLEMQIGIFQKYVKEVYGRNILISADPDEQKRMILNFFKEA